MTPRAVKTLGPALPVAYSESFTTFVAVNPFSTAETMLELESRACLLLSQQLTPCWASTACDAAPSDGAK
jgi:hypothetical protein